ncbi:DUF3263 domain-containing protein [Aestuariimicrobium ganziense]|uniref:DUF3263 domain-containing protein n=1 Tax=Aestuariimicrobium ganziense TaxID=2773677 RepID=UPI001F27EAEF|nr:DUF3263 domain-containing protein [Aestuariimicrobium ganziense]
MSVAHNEVNPAALSEREAEILDFERSWWAASRSKDDEIRERFELSSTRYHQILNALLDNPAAMAHDALLVKRLRRQRDLRRDARSASRLVQHGSR